ncbi:DUF262 domain-containing protein [Flaviflexus massiliensis]|uniref:DUF262 domain-containing protein n=1 Tax=Flaviflexus massiliensis TaxID=1522309 RepID=UPI0006D5A2C6|nr:DUF262 domain-containing protein [Flaviflexus massiliensis]
MKGIVQSITKIFDGKSLELIVPVYQRNYDWTQKQCERLFDDLVDVVRSEREKHFFGAIVGHAETSWNWIVIDGQQRLTTVSLLMLALVHALEDGDIESVDPTLGKKINGDFIVSGDDDLQVKFKLKPVKNDLDAYQRVFEQSEELRESSNVTGNYRYFRERLRSSDLTADRVWEAICGLEVMHLNLEKHDDPQRIFESLNSTGLDLTEADKIRNLVLMGLDSKKQQHLYDKRWNPMEINVDYKTSWFIRWYLVSKTGRTPRESEVYEDFKAYLLSASDVEAVVDDMHMFSKLCRELHSAATGMPTVDKRLARFSLIFSDVTLPFLMPVYRDVLDGKTTESDFERVIHLVESYIVRRVMAEIPTNSLNKIFATMYNELIKLRQGKEEYTDILTYLLRRRDGGSGRFPSNSEFLEGMRTRNVYKMRRESRQFLFESLENLSSKDSREIANKLASGELSIEHVMPQTLSEAWKKELGEDYEEIHETWLNRLGNLTITGYNSEYSNLPFAEKVSRLNGFSSASYRLNQMIVAKETWGRAEIEERTDALAKDALTLWPMAETDFVAPPVILPSEPLGSEGSFRYRKVAGVSLWGSSKTVSVWPDAVVWILQTLLESYRSKLFAFAENESLLHVGEKPESMWGPKPVTPGLWFEGSNDTDTKIDFLRRVFEDLELDPEEVVFTLRPDSEAVRRQEETVTEPFEELLKFVPKLCELETLNVEQQDTADIRQELGEQIEKWAPGGSVQALGVPLDEFLQSHDPANASTQEILAVLGAIRSLGRGYVHSRLVDGTLSSWLSALEGRKEEA